MQTVIPLLLQAHDTPLAVAVWLAVVILVLLMLRLVVRLLRDLITLRNEWTTRPR